MRSLLFPWLWEPWLKQSVLTVSWLQGMLTRRQASLAASQKTLEIGSLLNAEDLLESDTENESSMEGSLGRQLAKATPAKKVCSQTHASKLQDQSYCECSCSKTQKPQASPHYRIARKFHIVCSCRLLWNDFSAHAHLSNCLWRKSTNLSGLYLALREDMSATWSSCLNSDLQVASAQLPQDMLVQENEGEVVKKRSFKRSKSAEEQARRIKERNRRAQQVSDTKLAVWYWGLHFCWSQYRHHIHYQSGNSSVSSVGYCWRNLFRCFLNGKRHVQAFRDRQKVSDLITVLLHFSKRLHPAKLLNTLPWITPAMCAKALQKLIPVQSVIHNSLARAHALLIGLEPIKSGSA